eukprot:COSAG01_NODE_720_length_14070_cov_9.960633_14_plen_42_part_00
MRTSFVASNTITDSVFASAMVVSIHRRKSFFARPVPLVSPL